MKFKNFIPWIILAIILGGLVAWYFLSKRVTNEQIVTYQQIIGEARESLEAKEYSTAMNKYYEAVDVIPSRVEAYDGIVEILLEKNRINDALDIVNKSTRKVGGYDRSMLYQKIGDKYLENGEYDNALSIYLDGVLLTLNNPSLELSLGKVYLKKGNVNKAKSQFEKNIYSEDTLYEAILLRSYIYGISNIEDAKDILESTTPSDIWKPFFDEYSEVLDSLNEDIKYNATKLSKVYINNDFPYLAIEMLEPIADEILEYLEGMYFLGRSYMEYGDYDSAIEYLDRALTLGGMEEDILWSKARAYLGKNELENAISCYSSAIDYAGKNASEDMVSEYLDLLIENNQTIKASTVVQKLIAYISSAYIRIYGVKINSLLNDTKKVDYYLGLLSKMKLSDEVKKEYLYLYAKRDLEKGNIDEAKKNLDAIALIDTFYPYYYYLYGKIEISLGNTDNAKDLLKKAIEYDMNNLVSDEASRLLSDMD
ncbi:MAG: tetratricopeptide repeat protein [Candidatus Dojkabacteria bacterium]|nr:tetratricopeptide repeat protein [Candidatus Dojkabacteria bacterium]